MFRIFLISFCFISFAYAGLKDNIKGHFNKCVNNPFDEYHVSYDIYGEEKSNPKELCFNDFMQKYGSVLKKQCENNKAEECMMSIYALTYLNSNENELNEIATKLLDFCKDIDCYKSAEILGFNSDLAQPLLEKACNQNVDDACYAIGK